MAVLKENLRASSLVEVITALVILTMVFTFSGIIYLNVLTSTQSERKWKVQLVAQEAAVKAKKDSDFSLPKFFELRGFRVSVTSSAYRDNANLIRLRILVFDEGGKLLYTLEELVRVLC